MSTMTTPHTEGYADRTLGALARDIPGATAIFREHHLDFCCGGDQTLDAAAQAKGLDASIITSQLAALDDSITGEMPPDVNGLIDLIVSRFHNGHRRELPELIVLATKVEQVHANHPAVPAGLAQMLQTMLDELESHMQKEEQILFPLMRRNPGGFLAPPISRMRAEHDDHARMLQRLEQVAHDFRAPAEACSTWRALYVGLDHFTAEFMQHVHTENNILFPQFEGGG